MATIADLNVRLGVIIADLEKGLAKAERQFRRSGQKFAQIGNELTIGLSAPLALLGGAAIKTAGDFEALELALTSQLGSARAAREELSKLQKSAELPGLAFEQAVKGSVQLQAVGFSADRARETIEAFGNGLALVGKGGAELDGVLLALTQISAKGVVSAEEINQIAERLPQIRTLMKQAFGTANTEAIQKLGITSEVFIDAITKELQKLPKATGGIKNSIENSADAVKRFLASLGGEINKAFNLPELAQKLSETLNRLAKGFAGLDDSTKRFVITVGGLLVAFGPLVKLIGVGFNAAAALTSAFQAITSVTGALAGGVLKAAAAFKALDAAQKATVIGAAVAVVAALAFAFNEYANNANKAAKAQEAYNEGQQNAVVETQKQTASVNVLARAVQNEALSQEERIKALNELKRISPEYFGNLDIEKGKVVGLDGAVKNYVASMLSAAKARAALADIEKNAATINELQKRRNELEKDLQKTRESAVESEKQLQTLGSSGARLGSLARAEGTEKAIDAVLREIQALEDLNIEIEKNIKVTDIVTGSQGETAKAYGNAADAVTKEADEIKKALKLRKDYADAIKGLGVNAPDGPAPDIAAQPDLARVGSQALGGLAAPIQQTAEEVEKANQIAKDFASTFENVGFSIAGTLAQVTNGTITASDALQKLYEGLRTGSASAQAQIETLQSGLIEVIANIGSAIGEGASSFAEFAASATNSIAQVISALLKEWVAQLLVNSAFAAANPFAAIAIGAAAASIGAGLFKRIIGSLTAPVVAVVPAVRVTFILKSFPATAMVGPVPAAAPAAILGVFDEVRR